MTTAGQGSFHIQFRVRVMFIIQDTIVTVRCRTAIMCCTFNLCQSVKLDSLSCSFTSIPFLTNKVINNYSTNDMAIQLGLAIGNFSIYKCITVQKFF
jgi:hypothetical protein